MLLCICVCLHVLENVFVSVCVPILIVAGVAAVLARRILGWSRICWKRPWQCSVTTWMHIVEDVSLRSFSGSFCMWCNFSNGAHILLRGQQRPDVVRPAGGARATLRAYLF